ncbi:hypothetical protein HETIRDRAFT_315947 [Heterobasidion irregulare TC 32-1]|uniref:Isopenicillin N synthase-like Fe(2+) 2OG dioxygenase domain-containing protein n=1 Tax=Heterobasidion irregulare (strain TC 32-1) TaxID=747525 RepID=W4KAZ1_HETIT|nr:uncharacterized protein HETIRDRAFT_315947 [Heterobasidion irregulare TC 32-1]ETW83002.1 hypothetical protein HETIRDRAFT_315947 [Heterobasidion irregulare TC 32-1]
MSLLQVELEEKKQYETDIKKTGTFLGYKLPQYWHIANGVKDRIEHYRLNRNVDSTVHPVPLRPFLPEIQSFIKFNHIDVGQELLGLLALGLELPEDALVKKFSYEEKNNANCEFRNIYPHPKDEEIQTEGVWLKGHTDQGLLTILWSQPVSALQIRDEDGKWRWVRHVENALVCLHVQATGGFRSDKPTPHFSQIVNCGDSLEMLSGDYYKSAIHRVVQPPEDQQGYNRLGVFYFGYADDDVQLEPLTESPVLQRVGFTRHAPEGKAPFMGDWRKARAAAYGTSNLQKGEEEGIEEEVVGGIRVKHYN